MPATNRNKGGNTDINKPRLSKWHFTFSGFCVFDIMSYKIDFLDLRNEHVSLNCTPEKQLEAVKLVITNGLMVQGEIILEKWTVEQLIVELQNLIEEI